MPSVIMANVLDDGQLSDDQSDYSDDRDANEENLHVIEEYRYIVKLYRKLPRDMFVAQLLKDYLISETDLDRIRTEYSAHLKQVTPDFPFGSDAELTLRMTTRNGESVASYKLQKTATVTYLISH